MPRSPVRTPIDARAVGSSTVLPGKAREQIDALGFDLLGQPLRELAQRDDVVAVVLERRRRDRQPELAASGQEVDVVVVDRRAERRALGLEVGNQIAQRRRIEQRARQLMRAGLARLLDDGDRQRLAALAAFCSCASRSAADRPAGPAADDQDIDFERFAVVMYRSGPQTSGPQTWTLLLQLRDERRRDLEQVALDAVVGHFEDRRLGVLVDGDDRARALHADQVLNRARDAERDVQLRRHRLARAADLALHRQPAVVADRPRRRELGAERLGELLGDRRCSPAT